MVDILDTLAHRYPFLMIDRVVQVTPVEIHAIKNVTRNEPHFQGHFPGNPVMPGVMVLEALFQTGALFSAQLGINTNTSLDKAIAYVTTVEKAKFLKPVVPGDQLVLKVNTAGGLGIARKFIGAAYVSNEKVAEASWMAMRVKENV